MLSERELGETFKKENDYGNLVKIDLDGDAVRTWHAAGGYQIHEWIVAPLISASGSNGHYCNGLGGRGECRPARHPPYKIESPKGLSLGS